jgi:elongation factor G
MLVEVETPLEYQGQIVGDLNSRRGIILSTENFKNHAAVRAEAPLVNLFGYATTVRSLSKGMATFTMEMSRYARVPQRIADEIIAARRQRKAEEARK